MYRKSLILLLTLATFTFTLQAQEYGYGFSVGLNFSKFDAPSEKDAAGNELETFKYNTGFHVTASFIYKIVDNYGIRTGLTFSQRGGEYIFEGNGTQVLVADNGTRVGASGARKDVLSITNSYLEVPLVGYARVLEKLEIFGGASLNFLVGSEAFGERTFSGNSNITGTPVDFTSALDYKYFKDEVPSTELFRNIGIPTVVQADGQEVFIPEAMTAYYDFENKDGSIYNVVDLSAIIGLAFYLNKGLYISGSANFGLLDATNETYDISKTQLNGLDYVPTNDKDRNFFIQTSVGFSF